MTSIVGFGMTRFGKRNDDLISLAVESSQGISAKYSDSIDLVLVSNSYCGEYTGLSGLSDHVCSSRNKAEIEIKNRVIHIFVKSPNRNVKLYIDDLLVLQAKSSSKGVIRIKMISDTGQDLYRAIKSGKTIEYTITD